MNQLAEVFKALSDPTRLRILSLLLESPCCVCELVTTLGLPQPSVSRHLANLRHAGIVESRREGVRIVYSMCNEQVLPAFFWEWLQQVLHSPAGVSERLRTDDREPRRCGIAPPARKVMRN